MSDLDSILGLKPSARQITDTESSGTEIVNEDDEESVIDCDFALEEKENALLKASCERKCEGSMQNDSTESDKSHSLDNASNLHSHTSANSEQKSVNTSDCTDQVVYNSTNMTDNSQFTQTLSFVQHNVQVLPGVAGFTWKMVAESCAEGSANRGKILYSSGSVFPLQIDSKSQTTNPAKECTGITFHKLTYYVNQFEVVFKIQCLSLYFYINKMNYNRCFKSRFCVKYNSLKYTNDNLIYCTSKDFGLYKSKTRCLFLFPSS